MTTFIINYVGHPYQGSFIITLHVLRSKIWASLFAVLQSTLWEYLWEGGWSNPVSGLIVTPLGGIILGELGSQGYISHG